MRAISRYFEMKLKKTRTILMFGRYQHSLFPWKIDVYIQDIEGLFENACTIA